MFHFSRYITNCNIGTLPPAGRVYSDGVHTVGTAENAVILEVRQRRRGNPGVGRRGRSGSGFVFRQRKKKKNMCFRGNLYYSGVPIHSSADGMFTTQRPV